MRPAKLLLRLQRILTGQHYLAGESETITVESETRQPEPLTKIRQSGSQEAFSIPKEWRGKAAEDDKPGQRRFRLPHWPGKIKMFFRKIHHYFYPELTVQEKDELERQKRTRALEKMYKAEGLDYVKVLRNAYHNLGLSFTDSKGKVHLVGFDKFCWSEDGRSFYFHVGRIPYGINPARLVTDDILTGLSVSTRHPTHGILGDQGQGVIITIERAGRQDMPDFILFRDLLKLIPAGAPTLAFLIGVTKNGGREWRTLEAMPHLLGAGETGSGKTIFMLQMICTFISRNKPDNVKLIMIDLKSGIALNRFAGIPHLVTDIKDRVLINPKAKDGEEKYLEIEVNTGIATNLYQALILLRWAYAEVIRRNNLFSNDEKHSQKIDDWNKHHRNKKLPRIVIVIDELALLLDKSDIDDRLELAIVKEARQLIKNLLRLSRSSGIHLVGFTQSLDKDVMGVAFKTNVAGRVCFAVADSPSSILVIGTGAAVNLTPAGRAVFKRGVDFFPSQTPFITEGDINEVSQAAKEGKEIVNLISKTLTPEEIIKWSIAENEMMIPLRDVYRQFGGLIEWNKMVSLLYNMTNQIYTVDGFNYRVIQTGARKNARRIEKVEDTDDKEKNTIT